MSGCETTWGTVFRKERIWRRASDGASSPCFRMMVAYQYRTVMRSMLRMADGSTRASLFGGLSRVTGNCHARF
ncbi:MAG: hypothetical protein ACFFCW_16965 [Candidatus Hodarchaeota archaeon]